jgi:hypothetical protein
MAMLCRNMCRIVYVGQNAIKNSASFRLCKHLYTEEQLLVILGSHGENGTRKVVGSRPD